MQLLVTTDIGIISLGKKTFFKILPFEMIEKDPCDMVEVKNVHGINAVNKNIV
jgi:hypothetical protein